MSRGEDHDIMREMHDELSLLYKFVQDSPRLDFNEDITLSWISIMSEKIEKTLQKYNDLIRNAAN